MNPQKYREMTNEERIMKLETNLSNLKEDIDEIKTAVNDKSGLKELRDMLKEHVDWEYAKYDEMDRKFANKWVEKLIIAIILGGAVAVVGLIIDFVKTFNHF